MWGAIDSILRTSPCPNIIKRDYECECGHKGSMQVDIPGFDLSAMKCPECGDALEPDNWSTPYLSAEEFAIHDYEDMPSCFGEYTSLADIADYVQFVEHCDSEHSFDQDTARQIFEHCNGDLNEAEDMCERYVGTYDSMIAYAESLVDDGCFGEIADSIIAYINYDAIARDLRIDHDTIETDSHHLMIFHS
jgi:antirestriction protein